MQESEFQENCIKIALKNIFLNSKNFIFTMNLTLPCPNNAFRVNLQEIAKKCIKKYFFLIWKISFCDEPKTTLHQQCIWTESGGKSIKTALKNIFLKFEKFHFMTNITLHL